MLHYNGKYDMKNIVFKLNSEDSFTINNPDFSIDLASKEDYHHTFYKSLRLLYRMPNFFQTEALDLFYISLMVYFADRKVLRTDYIDNWTRGFKLYVPVLHIEKWNQNKELLENMISYLSGDIWRFEFRERNLNEIETKILTNIDGKYKDKKFNPDAFCMLSGGLDSFIGAIDLLTHSRNIGFVGHYGGGKGVKPFQEKINKLLKTEYGLKGNEFFNFHAAPLKGVEDTTRTRSFMFFAHAIILASCSRKNIELYIPENGLISLNIPLTNTRLGSSSTRTTHPYYMKLLQTLLTNLEIKITLKNPYQFSTKGEMMINCFNTDFIKENYKFTMSCSHPDQGRYKKESEPFHCGTCLPCTIRRASILKAYNKDKSFYRDSNYKENKAQIELKSFKIGLQDYRNSINNKFSIQIAGQIDERLDEYNGLYNRGMTELGNFLDLQNE